MATAPSASLAAYAAHAVHSLFEARAYCYWAARDALETLTSQRTGGGGEVQGQHHSIRPTDSGNRENDAADAPNNEGETANLPEEAVGSHQHQRCPEFHLPITLKAIVTSEWVSFTKEEGRASQQQQQQSPPSTQSVPAELRVVFQKLNDHHRRSSPPQTMSTRTKSPSDDASEDGDDNANVLPSHRGGTATRKEARSQPHRNPNHHSDHPLARRVTFISALHVAVRHDDLPLVRKLLVVASTIEGCILHAATRKRVFGPPPPPAPKSNKAAVDAKTMATAAAPPTATTSSSTQKHFNPYLSYPSVEELNRLGVWTLDDCGLADHTALYIAAQEGHTAIVGLLMGKPRYARYTVCVDGDPVAVDSIFLRGGKGRVTEEDGGNVDEVMGRPVVVTAYAGRKLFEADFGTDNSHHSPTAAALAAAATRYQQRPILPHDDAALGGLLMGGSVSEVASMLVPQCPTTAATRTATRGGLPSYFDAHNDDAAVFFRSGGEGSVQARSSSKKRATGTPLVPSPLIPPSSPLRDDDGATFLYADRRRANDIVALDRLSSNLITAASEGKKGDRAWYTYAWDDTNSLLINDVCGLGGGGECFNCHRSASNHSPFFIACQYGRLPTVRMMLAVARAEEGYRNAYYRQQQQKSSQVVTAAEGSSSSSSSSPSSPPTNSNSPLQCVVPVDQHYPYPLRSDNSDLHTNDFKRASEDDERDIATSSQFYLYLLTKQRREEEKLAIHHKEDDDDHTVAKPVTPAATEKVCHATNEASSVPPTPSSACALTATPPSSRTSHTTSPALRGNRVDKSAAHAHYGMLPPAATEVAKPTATKATINSIKSLYPTSSSSSTTPTFPRPPPMSLAVAALVHERNHKNVTPLYIAAQEGFTRVVEVLLEDFVIHRAAEALGTAVKSHRGRGNHRHSQQSKKKGGEDEWAMDNANTDGSSGLFLGKSLGTSQTQLEGDDADEAVVVSLDAVAAEAASPPVLQQEEPTPRTVPPLHPSCVPYDNTLLTDSGFTPLYVAAQCGFLDIVKCLVAAGADPNVVCTRGLTSLYIAAQEGKVDVVRFFMHSCGCSSLTKTQAGFSPLFIASQFGHLRTVKCLVREGGCLPSELNAKGLTPMYIAAQEGHVPVVTFLYEAARKVRQEMLEANNVWAGNDGAVGDGARGHNDAVGALGNNAGSENKNTKQKNRTTRCPIPLHPLTRTKSAATTPESPPTSTSSGGKNTTKGTTPTLTTKPNSYPFPCPLETGPAGNHSDTQTVTVWAPAPKTMDTIGQKEAVHFVFQWAKRWLQQRRERLAATKKAPAKKSSASPRGTEIERQTTSKIGGIRSSDQNGLYTDEDAGVTVSVTAPSGTYTNSDESRAMVASPPYVDDTADNANTTNNGTTGLGIHLMPPVLNTTNSNKRFLLLSSPNAAPPNNQSVSQSMLFGCSGGAASPQLCSPQQSTSMLYYKSSTTTNRFFDSVTTVVANAPANTQSLVDHHIHQQRQQQQQRRTRYYSSSDRTVEAEGAAADAINDAPRSEDDDVDAYDPFTEFDSDSELLLLEADALFFDGGDPLRRLLLDNNNNRTAPTAAAAGSTAAPTTDDNVPLSGEDYFAPSLDHYFGGEGLRSSRKRQLRVRDAMAGERHGSDDDDDDDDDVDHDNTYRYPSQLVPPPTNNTTTTTSTSTTGGSRPITTAAATANTTTEPSPMTMEHRRVLPLPAISGRSPADVQCATYLFQRTNAGFTPLFIACQYGHALMVRYLVERAGCDPNEACVRDLTPLYIAAQEGRADIVKYFLNGCSVDVDEEDDENGGDCGEANTKNDDEDDNAKLPPSPKASTQTPLRSSSAAAAAHPQPHHRRQNNHHHRILVHVNTHTGAGFSPFFIASQYGHLAVVRLFMENNAKIARRLHQWEDAVVAAKAKAENDGCGTAADSATTNMLMTMMALCQQNLIDVDAINHNDLTALYIAASEGHSALVEYLLLQGADTEARNCRGLTPFLVAAENRRADTIRVLLRYGCDVTARTMPRTESAFDVWMRSRPAHHQHHHPTNINQGNNNTTTKSSSSANTHHISPLFVPTSGGGQFLSTVAGGLLQRRYASNILRSVALASYATSSASVGGCDFPPTIAATSSAGAAVLSFSSTPPSSRQCSSQLVRSSSSSGGSPLTPTTKGSNALDLAGWTAAAARNPTNTVAAAPQPQPQQQQQQQGGGVAATTTAAGPSLTAQTAALLQAAGVGHML